MTRLILASASSVRAGLLRGAGVPVEVVPAAVDETEIKSRTRAEGRSAAVTARMLAQAKAGQIAALHPDALVIGADQILVCDGEWFDKPPDLAAARAQLQRLRGRAHRLITAVCVTRGGTVLWHGLQQPELTMREFSNGFLDSYIAAEGEAVLGSVGAYRLEGIGVQLFERVEGSYFAVLGLPLIELLGFLRRCGALEE